MSTYETINKALTWVFVFMAIISILILLIAITLHSTRYLLYILIYIVVLSICIYFGKYLTDILKQYIYSPTENPNMVIMGNIWYVLFIIFIMLICALFIKSVKESTVRMNIVYACVGIMLILFIYTILYYIIMFYDRINKIIIYLTIIEFIATCIVIILIKIDNTYLNNFLSYLYIIYGIITFTFIIALIIYIYYILDKSYDYFFV